MSARQKLNRAVITGALLMAALLWSLTGSGRLALLTAIGLIGLGLHNGSYRADSTPPRFVPRRRQRRR